MKGLIHTFAIASLLGIAQNLAAAEQPNTPESTKAAAEPLPSAQEAALEALKQAPLDGEKLELSVDGEPVFALFSPALGKRRGGVILLHDISNHVDSPGVIHPLRTGLPEYGWATLAVSLPQPEGTTATVEWLDSTRQRINAAINEMQKRGVSGVVLVGHGLGALAATDYLAAKDNLTVQGLVIIGMDGSANSEPRLDGAVQLGKVRPRIMDIFGGHDQRRVLDSAQRRADAARRRDGGEQTAHTVYRDVARNYSESKGDNVGYRQIRIAPAAHDFSRQEALLLRRVRGWLGRYVKNGK